MIKKKQFIEMKEHVEIYNNLLDSMEFITGVHRNFFRIKRSRRANEITLRYMLVHLLHKYIPSWTLEQIAWKTGMGDHSSIIHSLKKVNEWKDIPQMFKSEVDILIKIETDYGQRIESFV
jgi:chromosomal replication initiation ATPase DnaA